MRIEPVAAAEVFAVRRAVLWPGKPPEFSQIAEDHAGWHFGAFEGGRLVCVASLFFAGNEVRLRKFATLPEFQRQGIGSAMLQRCLDEARMAGCHHFWCDARVDAVPFYRRFGLAEEAPAVMREGRQFVRMGRALAEG